MKCSNCKSTKLETDTAKGNTYCSKCGLVSEEVNIVSDINFDNTKVVGKFVNDYHSGPSGLKNKHGHLLTDSRQTRINNANKKIVNIAEKLCKFNFFIYKQLEVESLKWQRNVI